MANVTLVTPKDGTAILTRKHRPGSSCAFPTSTSYTRPNKNIPIPTGRTSLLTIDHMPCVRLHPSVLPRRHRVHGEHYSGRWQQSVLSNMAMLQGRTRSPSPYSRSCLYRGRRNPITQIVWPSPSPSWPTAADGALVDRAAWSRCIIAAEIAKQGQVERVCVAVAARSTRAKGEGSRQGALLRRPPCRPCGLASCRPVDQPGGQGSREYRRFHCSCSR
jgi:hypothetical protein